MLRCIQCYKEFDIKSISSGREKKEIQFKIRSECSEVNSSEQ